MGTSNITLLLLCHCPLQVVYRRKCSTAEAISLTLHSTLEYVVSKDTYIGFLFIDYTSAFYTIIPTKLISIIPGLGLGPSLCDWNLGSLTQNPQSVRIDNSTSSTIILNTGIPQGYAPSPRLYSL